MMVNIRKRVATVNIGFSSSRRAALSEGKMLRYKFSIKLHYCTLSERKTQFFTLSDVPVCLGIHWAGQKKHSNPHFLTISVNITLQTCVDKAIEYQQGYNTKAGVKFTFSVVCINVYVQVIQCFC